MEQWTLELRVDGLTADAADRLYGIFIKVAYLIPGAKVSGGLRPAADWPAERAAILEAVEAVDRSTAPGTAPLTAGSEDSDAPR